MGEGTGKRPQGRGGGGSPQGMARPEVRAPVPGTVRLTRRGRVVLAVLVALIALGVFWLGTRAGVAAESWRVPGAAKAAHVPVGQPVGE
ncbi:hypothetical protein [Spongiactinospora sp. 9N601]|uniref:hypothetical protein n=1 Tax=Spongiactinospora sp. 9N601 TaxID=3375149 RepID=UPI0037967A94